MEGRQGTKQCNFESPIADEVTGRAIQNGTLRDGFENEAETALPGNNKRRNITKTSVKKSGTRPFWAKNPLTQPTSLQWASACAWQKSICRVICRCKINLKSLRCVFSARLREMSALLINYNVIMPNKRTDSLEMSLK